MTFDPSLNLTSISNLLKSALDIINSDQFRAALRYPPGHYYSPLTDPEEVTAKCRLDSQENSTDTCNGFINYRKEDQLELLTRLSAFYNECPFGDEQTEILRYFYKNDYFSYSDAIFLYCFLRYSMPSAIVEIGSGFSSAAMLDTSQELKRRYRHNFSLTFIEPYPDRLKLLLRQSDQKNVHIVESKVQALDPDFIATKLAPGDLLFVDSSHVLKCGSDLHYILFKLLPALSPGVYIHFHDIFCGFEYPKPWLDSGLSWNECYALQAFLAHNDSYKIIMFADFANRTFPDWIEAKMPKCRLNFGGSLYIQKL